MLGTTRPLAIACPACLGPLDEAPLAWGCGRCGASYRGLRGIPDLRTSEDAYLPNADDWALALRLDEAFDRLDFRGLLDLYFDLCPDVDPPRRARQVAHILTAPGRAAGWVEALGPDLPAGPWLDLGCGSGSFLAARGHDRVIVGLDVAMRWLLVARKRLDEEGLGQVRLACGNAERLPFAEGSFAAVVAGDVLEHVADQAATLAEAYRILINGGSLMAATPNRFSLAPEPHVGLWGIGLLPRRWMSPYVRTRGRGDFRAIRTLGYAAWTLALRSSPFGGSRIACPPLPDDDLAAMGAIKRTLAHVYNWVVGSRVGQAAMRRVGPLFWIVATRPNRGPRPPTRP